MRLKGMAAVFNDAARMRLCESSGSEHYTPEDSDDLSDLVNSFMENTIPGVNNLQENEYSKLEEYSSSDSDQNNNLLEDLLISSSHNNEDDQVLRREIQLIASEIKSSSQLLGFKRKLMSHLRDRGFDAGLCKSRWGKFGKHPAGEYEYVDVVNAADGNRFIVEVNLATEFEIARPTTAYTTLLNKIPQVLVVGKAEAMKQIVRLMCSALRMSMKQRKLHVPPWRRNGYMQAKWFGPYKRTTNEIHNSSSSSSCDQSNLAANPNSITTGFDPNFQAKLQGYNYLSGKDWVGLKVGYLTAALINQ